MYKSQTAKSIYGDKFSSQLMPNIDNMKNMYNTWKQPEPNDSNNGSNIDQMLTKFYFGQTQGQSETTKDNFLTIAGSNEMFKTCETGSVTKASSTQRSKSQNFRKSVRKSV